MGRQAEVWSPVKLQRARDLLQTETIEETSMRLADEFGGTCSVPTLRSRMDACGFPWPGRTISNRKNATRPSWSEGKRERFRQLKLADKSNKEIVAVLAAEYGIRHGKHTMNRVAREMNIAVPIPRKTVKARAREAISQDFDFSNTKMPTAVPPTRITRCAECQYPIGEPGQRGFRFCGAQTVMGRSYCDEHLRGSYVARPERTSA